jgi:uncharacterized lipoprotein YbaY
MKLPLLSFLAALGLVAVGAGCQHLDLTPESSPHRVVTGNIVMRQDGFFPADTEALVRVVDLVPLDRPRNLESNNIRVAEANPQERNERVLGSQVVRVTAARAIPFRIEFEADEALLRHGLNVDVRISVEGKIRYRTLSAHMITLSSLPFALEVAVDQAQ